MLFDMRRSVLHVQNNLLRYEKKKFTSLPSLKSKFELIVLFKQYTSNGNKHAHLCGPPTFPPHVGGFVPAYVCVFEFLAQCV